MSHKLTTAQRALLTELNEDEVARFVAKANGLGVNPDELLHDLACKAVTLVLKQFATAKPKRKGGAK